MDINYLKELFELISNKYQHGYVSGDEFNSLWKASETDYLQYLLGHTEQYQPGRPIPRVGLGMSKSISEKLAAFREQLPVTVPANGQQSKTAISAGEACHRDSDGKSVTFTQPNRVAAKRNSTINLIEDYPIYTEYDDYFQFYPIDIGDVTFTNINYPPETKWNFTTAGGRETYEAVGSIDPLWKNTDCLMIIGRMLRKWGVSIKDVEVAQYGQSVILTGE